MSKKRQFFSRKNDGTTFSEDLKAWLEEIKEEWAADRLEKLLERIQQLDDLYEGKGEVITAFGNKVHEALNSPTADAAIEFLKGVIPGEADDAVLEWIQNEGVDKMLELWAGVGQFIGTAEEKLQQWINSLRGGTPDFQEAAVERSMAILLREYSLHENVEHGTPELSAQAANTYVRLAVDLAAEVV